MLSPVTAPGGGAAADAPPLAPGVVRRAHASPDITSGLACAVAGGYAKCGSTAFRMFAFGYAPTSFSTGLPPLNSTIVGIDMIPS